VPHQIFQGNFMQYASHEVIDLKGVLTFLRRQFRVILMSVLLVLGSALIYLFYVTPLYTSTALLLVDPARKNLLNPDDGTSLPGSAENARVESEVEILKSGAVALATVEALGLLRDPEFGPQIGLSEKIKTTFGIRAAKAETGGALLNATLNRFADATSVRRRGQTYLIAVSVSAKDPDRAARFANVMAQTYIELQIRSKVNASLAARDILLAQTESSRRFLVASEDALDSFIDRNFDRLQRESGGESLGAMREQLLAANATRLSAELLVTGAKSALSRNDWGALAQSLGDDALAVLAGQRQELDRRLGRSVEGSTEETNLRSQLAAMEEGLKNRSEAVIARLQSEIVTLENETRITRSGIRRSVLQGDLSSSTLAQIYELQQNADIAQRQYATLLSRSRDLGAQAMVQIADSRIVSAALSRQDTSFPNTKLIMSLALVAALGVGVSLAVLNEFYVGGITSVSHLAMVLPVPVATAVPRTEQQKDQFTVADTIVDAPLSAYAESMRRLRVSIDQSVLGKGAACSVIMVSSSLPAEGKTTVALALARTYALAGKSTLLLDADLRKPSLHRYLDLKPEQGFLEYLRDPEKRAENEKFYAADPRSPVVAVLGRSRSEMPADRLLQSSLFENLLKNARAAMDIIILDTSPLIPVVDARYVAPHADVIVHCVRFGGTGQNDLRAAFEQLSDSVRPGTPIFSVLNHDESRAASYRYDGHYAGYSAG
jgi:polysaccharide biosynthesis transport protein